jgi:hypothetical protein
MIYKLPQEKLKPAQKRKKIFYQIIYIKIKIST